MLNIIAKEFCNNKTNLQYCFVGFRKDFDMVCRRNLWNILEELKVPLELSNVVLRLYENVISKFRNVEAWLEEINCDIGVMQGFPLSPSIFGICIDNLESYLEEVGGIGTTLARIVIVLLLYTDAIVFMARCPFDLNKKLIILKEFSSSMGMLVNTNKTKL
jgi:hypothetical protein